jgi:Flp pilus assembly protein TadD
VGAGIAFRQANRPDLAQQEFLAALAVDPANAEARQNLAEMGITPPAAAVTSTSPAPTPSPIAPVAPR